MKDIHDIDDHIYVLQVNPTLFPNYRESFQRWGASYEKAHELIYVGIRLVTKDTL